MRRISILAAALVVACEAPSVQAPERLVSVHEMARLESGVVQSVNAAALRWTAGEIFVQTLHAQKRTDGTVSGGFHADAKYLNARFDVTITCFEIDGNRAWIGGIVRDSDTPLIANGTATFFYVIDNGEGAIGAIQQDIVSAVRLNAPAGAELAFCGERPLTLPSRRIEDGNIQVRG